MVIFHSYVNVYQRVTSDVVCSGAPSSDVNVGCPHGYIVDI